METVQIAWGATIGSSRQRHRQYDVYAGVTYWRDEWFGWEPLPRTLAFAVAYRDELVARFAGNATDADGVLGEIARGICGPKVAAFFVSDLLEGSDPNAKEKALAFGVSPETWDQVLQSAIDAGAGE